MKPLFGRDAYAEIADYLRSRGKEDEAGKYQKRSIDFAEQLAEAASTLNTITAFDKYEDHKLTPAQVEALCAVLSADKRLKTVYVVAKNVPEIVGGHQHILVAQLSLAWTENNSEKAHEVLQALAKAEEVAGFYLLTWDAAPTTLTKSFKNLPTAKIYEKNK